MADHSVLTIGRPVPSQLKEQVEKKLLWARSGERFIPSALLWGDDAALKLFEAYSTLPEYYPTLDEINTFKHWGEDIARHVDPGSVLIDLGCGNVHKIKPFLDKLEESEKPVTYYALDLSDIALERNLQRLSTASYKFVKYAGLWGTFEDVREWAKAIAQPIWFFSLGSIFGNDQFDIAVQDLRLWSQAMQPKDRFLIGVDGCDDKDRVWRSYNTPIPGKQTMVEHSLEISNNIVNHEWYRPNDWEIRGVSQYDGTVCTHEWVARALNNVRCDELDLDIPRGEEIRTTKWFKWGPEGMLRQFDHSGFDQITYWKSPTGPFYQYLVKPAKKE